MIEVRVDGVVRSDGKPPTVTLSALYDGIKRYQVIFRLAESAAAKRTRVQAVNKQRFDERGVFECENLNIEIPSPVFSVMLRRACAILFIRHSFSDGGSEQRPT